MTGRPRIELYLRSLAPSTGRKRQNRTVERLQELDEAGRIKGFDVVLCGDCVCPKAATAETDPGRRLLERYEQFEEWAEEAGYELSGFERRDIDSVLTGTTVTGIVFPRMVLAEYRSGDVTFVAPATDGTETVDVDDRLRAYAEQRA